VIYKPDVGDRIVFTQAVAAHRRALIPRAGEELIVVSEAAIDPFDRGFFVNARCRGGAEYRLAVDECHYSREDKPFFVPGDEVVVFTEKPQQQHEGTVLDQLFFGGDDLIEGLGGLRSRNKFAYRVEIAFAVAGRRQLFFAYEGAMIPVRAQDTTKARAAAAERAQLAIRRETEERERRRERRLMEESPRKLSRAEFAERLRRKRVAGR
jgi:hypothetical protein